MEKKVKGKMCHLVRAQMRMFPSQNSRSKSPKPTFKNNCEVRARKTVRHLIVLPATHEVLVRFNVISHLERGDHLEKVHLEHHPASSLSFQVTIHLAKVGNLVTVLLKPTFQGPCARLGG